VTLRSRILVEASLDGEPPASAPPQPEKRAMGRNPIFAPVGHRAVLVKSFDRKPFRAVPPAFGLLGRARACSSASDVPYRAHLARSGLSVESALANVGLAPAAASSKNGHVVEPERLPSTSTLSSAPRLRSLLAQLPNTKHEITESPPPYPRLAQAGFERVFTSRPSRGQAPFGPSGYPGHPPEGEYRARVSRRLLQSEQPTSTTTNHPDPRSRLPA
jgi:hypothetical protein